MSKQLEIRKYDSSYYALVLIFFYVFCFRFYAHGQKSPSLVKPAWSIGNPFEHKVFIENAGQFDNVKVLHNLSGVNKIDYGISINGGAIYFTKKGLFIRLDELPVTSEKEKAEEDLVKNSANYIESKKEKAQIPSFVVLEWVQANESSEVGGELPVNYNFIYSDQYDTNRLKNIVAKAFEKIIYKEIYPGIDIEFTFQKDREGLKYAFLIHPGANPALIAMKYSGDISCFIEEDNVHIKTSLGNLVDHKPLSFYQDDKNSIISSSFLLNDKIVSFKLDNYNNNETVVIDPWLTIPGFFGYSSAYDLEYDTIGNTYVYGGQGGVNPFQEIKINNVGSIQWVYTTNLFASNSYANYYYGDFVVNKYTGTSYIAEGANFSSGPNVIKLNSSGLQTGLFSGDPNLNEIWRVSYDYCSNKIITAGGHSGASSGSAHQASILDTNMTSFVPVNFLLTGENTHDVSLMALDNSNNCYMATCQSSNYPTFNNILVKCPTSTLFPPVYMVPDGHTFYESSSISYINGGFSAYTNGFNGMAVNDKYVYTYDGSVIKKWNKNTGIFINSVSVGATAFLSGGIAVDNCDNIFVGVLSSIKRYDSTLTLIATIPVSNTVYDVKLDKNDFLYSCGRSFATAFYIPSLNCIAPNPLSATINSITPCDSLASATVFVSGGIPPYTYLWSLSAGGQTTQTVSGLSSGNYSVTVTDASCTPYTISSNITITLSVHSFPSIMGIDTICFGSSTTLTATGGGTYNWNTGATVFQVVVNPSTSTIYSVVVSNGSCLDTANINIVVLPNPIISAGPDTTINIGSFAQLYANGGVSYAWSPSTGLSCYDCQDPITSPSVSTFYTVIVTDTNGCSSSSTVTIDINCGEIFVPTAFSPNNDSQNDLECAFGNCIVEMSFSIFDRWGEKVFETNNQKDCWDGTYKGKSLDPAVFVYHFTATLNNGKKINKHGNVSLIK